ncbi:MAG: ribonuclease [Fervidobacterium sp.]
MAKFEKTDIYSQEYVERLKNLEIKRKVILDVLRDYKKVNKQKILVLVRNFERPEKEGLNKINPFAFSFLLHSLFNINESIENKIVEFEKNKLSRYVLFEILFWVKPSSFPFPSGEVKSYKQFLISQRNKLKEHKLENFMQLYALESVQNDTFIKDIFEKILLVKPETLEEHLWIKDFAHYLSPIEKNKVKSKIHPYVWKVLTADARTMPVIIDGNNILMSKHLRGPEKIDVLLEYISKLDKVYFPFYIVFDENAKYKFQTRYFNYKKTYYHSPADELIISLAKEYNGVVCSMDRFKDYNIEVKNIWYELNI